MNLSKTSKYAFRILGQMAKDEKALHSAQQLHKEIDVPERYLRRILTNLSKTGFIKSIQGRQGGFTFARDISNINLLEVVESIDGLESINGCILGYESCAFNHSCPMHNIWEETKQKTIETLRSTTLNDIHKNSISMN
jgi:Rrf2 family protein